MPRGKRTNTEDQTTLQMALIGYQIERQKIDTKIRELEAQLGKRGSSAAPAAADSAAPRKRNLSPAARRRIALAQKRRWAEHRKRVAAAAKAAKS